MCQEGVFQHAFVSAGFSEDDAKAAPLGVDSEDIKDVLLVGRPGLRKVVCRS